MFSILEDDYEPNELDDEVFLSEVPLNLIEKAIEAQFENPEEYRKIDYIQSFINKYEFSLDNAQEDDLQELDDLRASFIIFLRDIFQKHLNVGFPELEDLSNDDQFELLHITYNFFIRNMKKNFVTFSVNYIKKYKDQLSEVLPRRKDVATINFKDEIDDEYDILILSNISTVFDLILEPEEEMSVMTFLDLCTSEKNCLETEFVKSKYNNFEITGNFIESYSNMINDIFRVEIEVKIRNKILLKYPSRNKKIIKKMKELEEEENGDNSNAGYE